MKKKAIIIGFGKSGEASLQLLLKNEYEIIVIDDFMKDSEIQQKKINYSPCNVSFKNTFNEEDFEFCSVIIVSPGISSDHSCLKAAKKKNIEIIGEVELAFRFLKRDIICIGVTGTNGKTTVTLLIEHILKNNGIKALAVGNIGIPLSIALEFENIDVFVIELSSFQLETLTSKYFDFGIILNISPDHLDRYKNFEEYSQVKYKLIHLIKNERACFVNDQLDPPKFFSFSTYGFQEKSNISYKNGDIFIERKLWIHDEDLEKFACNHDLENILAAICICSQFPLSSEKIMLTIKSFKKPSHRIEFVRNLNGVVYYNDSKGTNIDAVVKAVEYIKKNIILICGGVDKGASYNIWRKAFIGKVKSIFIIGQAASKISSELRDLFPLEIVSTLDEAIRLAYASSKNGDSVLLSPGCSSYDMFLNYEHRGNEFVRIVNSLPQ